MTAAEIGLWIQGITIGLLVADKVVAMTDNKYDDMIVTTAKKIFFGLISKDK